MQFLSLPMNSSLQNNPRHQFSLKSENIDFFPILSTAIRSRIFLVRIFYQPYLRYLPSLVFCFLDNFVIILESVLIDHMLPILTKVNYAVNSQKLWKIHQNCSNKFIIIQSFFSSLLLFLKVVFGNQNQV
jgi:hypothetical protein